MRWLIRPRLKKVSFGAAALLLYFQGRAGPWLAGARAIDLLLAGLFAIAFRASRASKGQPARCLGGNFN